MPSPTSSQVIQQIEANLLGAYTHLAHALGAQIHHDEYLTSFFTGHSLALCNGVIEARLPESQADTLIHTIMEEAHRREIPITWLLGPSSEPTDLEQRLEALGWTLDEIVPGMAIELEHHLASNRAASVPDLLITQVQDASNMQNWLNVFTTSFGLPTPMQDVFTSLFSTYGFVPSETVQYLLAWRNNTPVGTALLTIEADVPGIYAVSTLPEERRKGIGTALTLAAMHTAYQAGHQICTLQATPMGLPVYQRMGWQAYCTFKTYTFLP